MIKTNKIFFTGDIHGHIDIHKLGKGQQKRRDFLEKRKHTYPAEGDFLIVTGDFGFPFHTVEYDKETFKAKEPCYKWWLNWLKAKPYTILFVDGNHENFDFWDAQPVQEWHGGKVHIHPEAPNIIHLLRGEFYDLNGLSIFAFGGAASHDIDPEYDDTGRCIWKGRVEGKSWWKHENATPEEIEHAENNLALHGYSADIIITHTPPASVVAKLIAGDHKIVPDSTANFLDTLLGKVEYRHWLCGHIHKDHTDYQRNLTIAFRNIETIDEILHEGEQLIG